jgi:hypothetical protein
MLAASIPNNTWVHLAGVLDRGAGTFTAYYNGAYADSQSLSGLGTLDTTLPFDVSRTMMTAFKGAVDEARVIKTVLTADWLAAEHANLSDPGFAVLDTEEMR